MKRTKIVATLGPASRSYEELRKMIAAGLNIVRLNFSHGTPEEKAALVKNVRTAAQNEGKIIGILGDLQGPKIRVAKFAKGPVELKVDEHFALDANLAADAGDEHQVGIDYKNLPGDVKSGDVLLLDDGRVKLIVDSVEGGRINCTVTVGGLLSDHKGINREGGGLSAGALTDKDRADLKTAVELGVDYLAISFVRSAEDVKETKKLIEEAGGKAGVIAKIERIEAMQPDNLAAIVEASDGIMVARGDLGVEIGEENVPAAQKMMIRCARHFKKLVITATQMMESMIHNVVPTRAEVSDVANAVLDGTDAVMLSAESATGDHPALVVEAMARACIAAEQMDESCDFETCDDECCCGNGHDYCGSVCACGAVAELAVELAQEISAKALVVVGDTAKSTFHASRVHSLVPILGVSNNPEVLGKFALYSGVIPVKMDTTLSDETITAQLLKERFITQGKVVVVKKAALKVLEL